jgi:uncharacterized damage-inducible protein DinB
MFRSVAWADGRVVAALRECPAAQAEGLPLLAHLLAAEHVWLARLQGRQPRLPVWPQLTLDECDALVAENAAGYAAYLDGADDARSQAAIEYRNSLGEAFVTPAIDILTQVALHGAYHRGQIAKILGQAGVPAVGTDYITFIRSPESAGS